MIRKYAGIQEGNESESASDSSGDSASESGDEEGNKKKEGDRYFELVGGHEYHPDSDKYQDAHIPQKEGDDSARGQLAASKLDEQALRELRVGLRNIQMFYTNYNRDPSAATDAVVVQVSDIYICVFVSHSVYIPELPS